MADSKFWDGKAFPRITRLNDAAGNQVLGVQQSAVADMQEDSGAIGGSNDGNMPDPGSTPAALTENSGAIGGTSDDDLPAVVSAGVITDDDSAASNGLAVYLHMDELQSYAIPVGHLESITAASADADYLIGAAGAVVVIRDDDAANTGGFQVYFDEDAANPDERWLCNNSFNGKDAFVISSNGEAIRIKHDASASSNGVALFFDDDAATGDIRMLFLSPTDTAGSYTTDDQIGLQLQTDAIRELATKCNELSVDIGNSIAADRELAAKLNAVLDVLQAHGLIAA